MIPAWHFLMSRFLEKQHGAFEALAVKPEVFWRTPEHDKRYASSLAFHFMQFALPMQFAPPSHVLQSKA